MTGSHNRKKYIQPVISHLTNSCECFVMCQKQPCIYKSCTNAYSKWH